MKGIHQIYTHPPVDNLWTVCSSPTQSLKNSAILLHQNLQGEIQPQEVIP